MPFPEVPRVKYGKNPLDKVICQLRFPPILRIESEVPQRFQELLRGDFPGYKPKDEQSFKMTHDLQTGLQVAQSDNKNYEFSSLDETWIVNLTRTFLSLSTTEYVKWEDFRSRLSTPLAALVEEYKPACLVRMGLRYVDVINRDKLRLGDTDWNELLQPHALGFLNKAEISQSIKSCETNYIIQLADKDSKVRIVTALVYQNDEECFMIDADFFSTEKCNNAEGLNKLEFLHGHATKLIRWLITDRLHEAMEPEEL